MDSSGTSFLASPRDILRIKIRDARRARGVAAAVVPLVPFDDDPRAPYDGADDDDDDAPLSGVKCPVT